LGFRELKMSCWGCLEGIIRIDQDISPENYTKFSVSDVPQAQEALLTILVELRSWGFFGGSIDSSKYSLDFQ
jgi:hypothetical protein